MKPPTLQEEAALAARRLEETASFLSRLKEPLHPPTRHLGLKIVAGAAVLGAALYKSVELLSVNRWSNKQELMAALREALEERGR